MSLSRAAHQRKVRARGQTFVAVRIQPDAEHDRFAARLLVLGIRHACTVLAIVTRVKKASPTFELDSKASFTQTSAMVAKLKQAGRKRFKSLFRVYLGDEIALGPGKAELLRHILQTGSISESARRMEMSYNRAWLLVRTMNRCFKEPLVSATRGGDKHGGAELTSTGKQVLALYQQLESRVAAATQQSLSRILSCLKN